VRAVDQMRILVVEDELEVGHQIKGALESKLKAEVVPVTELDEARRLLETDDFDLVTLNCVSCLEFLDEAGQDGGLPPVVVITRQGAEAAAAHALKSGASGFVIQTPGWPDQLAQVAEEVIADSLLKRAVDLLGEQTAFVEAAVEESDELFFVFDRRARLVRWNKALKRLTGYADGELLQIDLGHFFAPDDAQRLENQFPRLTEWRVTSLSMRLLAKDGKPVPCNVKIGAVHDHAFRMVGIFGWGREAEAAVGIGEMTGEIILRTDENGVITYVNDRAREFLGAKGEELIGRPAIDFVHPDDIKESVIASQQAIKRRTMRVGTNRAKTPRGWRYVEWNGMPMYEASTGRFIGFQVTGRDVTEKKRSEELLVQMNVELEVFAHTVSHDLRGPLGTIMMAAGTLRQLLQDRTEEEAGVTVDELARMISDGAATAGKLIEDLLRLAESGLAPKQVEPVDVAEVVDQVALDHLALLEERHAKVEHTERLGHLLANRTQVYQVFSNLVCNALTHSEAEQPVVEISVIESWQGGYQYRVRDNGPGIAEDEMGEIFKPFFKEKGGGTGIGLATVEKIVKTYGGTIKAYNDGGAVFELSLNDFVV
jgi:PAS domain S-box-containing protein